MPELTVPELTGSALLLLLADSRLPAGGHAHSGGMEAAVASGVVHDEASLAGFLTGRLATAGLLAAGLAAAACSEPTAVRLARLDLEADARSSSPGQRAASRAQGRALLRAARALLGVATLPLRADPHHAVALGATAGLLGLRACEAALVAASAAVSGPASAALRLLGLDPLSVLGIQARLAAGVDAVARQAVCALPGVPAPGAPLLDLLAERHAARPVRLFAS